MPKYRYDKGEIRNAYFTPEGFLRVDAIVTRTGVFYYRNDDGSLRRELRHPDDILKQDSLKSIEMIPVTLMHPSDKEVNSKNAALLKKGFTGQDVRPDGKFIKTSFIVTDEDAIEAVLGNVRELSLGYSLELVEEAGEYGGERYDYRQTNVRYNHLAIVPSARAGSEASIKLDSNDAFQCMSAANSTCAGNCDSCNHCACSRYTIERDSKDNSKLHIRTQNTDTNIKPNKKEKIMPKVRIDGIEYDASQEVINRLERETQRADKAESSVSELQTNNSTLQANLDTANEEIKTLKAHDSSEEIKKAVDARIALVTVAKDHLDEEVIKNLDTMTDSEIKVAVIKAHSPEANLDGKDEVYIQARYDGAIEMGTKKDTKSDSNDGISSQRKAIKDPSKNADSNTVNQEKSRKDMVDAMKDAWKNKK